MQVQYDVLRRMIKEELVTIYLTEQGNEADKKKDVDYSLEDTGIKLPAALQKAMDPKNPADFAKKDEMIDASDNPKHQAAMLAKFALDYADGDEGSAQKILKLATTQGVKTLMGAEDEAGQKKNEGLSRSRMQQIIREEIAHHLLKNGSSI